MPEVSGIDFLEFVRMRPELKGLPVVMLSSETTDVQVDEALRKGANAFVFKPVTLEELEAALKKAMGTREDASGGRRLMPQAFDPRGCQPLQRDRGRRR